MNTRNKIIIGLICLALIIPLAIIQAGWIENLVKLWISALIIMIFWQNLVISWIVFSLGDGILRIITSPTFFNFSYTTNAFVYYGWGLVRDFVNMFFVIILALIGLGTALRFREYQWQKMIPTLLAMILLINFTPVILGLIIDGCNIVMDFFLGSVAGESWLISRTKEQVSGLYSSIKGMNVDSISSIAQALMLPIMMIATNWLIGIFNVLYAVLFLMRYIMLWMLIILSPLAFASYILPNTRKTFFQWWNQFIQWCVVGIGASFFLYLSDQLTYYMTSGTLSGEGAADKGENIGGLLGPVLPTIAVCGFLIVGFFYSLTSSAAGAQAVISAFQKKTKAAGTKFAQTTGRKLQAGVADSKVGQTISRAGEGLSRQQLKYTSVRDAKGFGGKVGAIASNTARWGARSFVKVGNVVGDVAVQQTKGASQQTFDQGREDIGKAKTADEAVRAMRQAKDAGSVHLAGAISKFSEMNKEQRNELLQSGMVSDGEVKTAMEQMVRNGKVKEASTLALSYYNEVKNQSKDLRKQLDNFKNLDADGRQAFANSGQIKDKSISKELQQHLKNGNVDAANKLVSRYSADLKKNDNDRSDEFLKNIEKSSSLMQMKEGKLSIFETLVKKAKPKDIEFLAGSMTPDTMNIARDNWSPRLFREAINEGGSDFVKMFKNSINDLSESKRREWIKNVNPEVALWAAGTSATDLGVNFPYNRDQVRNIIDTGGITNPGDIRKRADEVAETIRSGKTTIYDSVGRAMPVKVSMDEVIREIQKSNSDWSAEDINAAMKGAIEGSVLPAIERSGSDDITNITNEINASDPSYKFEESRVADTINDLGREIKDLEAILKKENPTINSNDLANEVLTKMKIDRKNNPYQMTIEDLNRIKRIVK